MSLATFRLNTLNHMYEDRDEVFMNTVVLQDIIIICRQLLIVG